LQSFPFAFLSLHTVCALVILFGTGVVAGVAEAGSLELASEEVAVIAAG
jgi:hypothetical protein